MFHLHLEEWGPGARSQKHGHVDEAAFYILDGEGYEIHDGVRYDWKAGDVAIVHNNCVHQHFNASSTKPARVLVMKTKPMFMFMNMLFQKTVEPRPTEPAPRAQGYRVREEKHGTSTTTGNERARWPGVNPRRGDAGPPTRSLSGAARRRRDGASEKRQAKTPNAPEDMPWEMSRQRLLRAPRQRGDEHPHGDGGCLHADCSARSRSGKYWHLAEECLYVLEGQGYSLHEDCDVEITQTTMGTRRPM